MCKVLNIVILVLLLGFSYSQTCTADAGGNLDITLTHEGGPGGEVTFDASATIGDNLIGSSYTWNIYHLPVDTLSYTANGLSPTIDVNCYSSQNPDNSWTDCIADYRVELIVACDDGNFSTDIINLSVTEPNSAPVACLTVNTDSYLTNEALLIPNNTGIPGEQTNVLLYTYIDFTCSIDPDGDLKFYKWYDEDDNEYAPIQPLGEGVYIITHKVKDIYDTYSEDLVLTIELDEENTLPTISIAAVNEVDVGLNQIIVDGTQFDLFGSIVDVYNDVDDVDADGNADDISYSWNYTVVPDAPFTIENGNTLNPTITPPTIDNNSDSRDITITLEAQDPFQVIDGESSISDPIIITVVNDNSAPIITNSISGYEIIEDQSSELNYANISSFIDVADSDETSFTLVVNQSDIDADPATYSNYSLSGLTTIVPDEDYYGEIRVPIRLDDEYTVDGVCYNCLSDAVDLVIDVTGVNDQPELTAPATLTTDEDTDLVLTGISVEDVDSSIDNNFNLQFNISVENGTLSLSDDNVGAINYTIGDGDEDTAMTFTTSVSTFNNAFTGAIFHPNPNYYGNDGRIIISVDDQGNDGDEAIPTNLTDSKTITIQVDNVNDPPLITSSNSYNIDEDSDDFYLTDIVLSDEDVANGQMILELTVSNGTLELSSIDNITCLDGGNCFDAVSNMQFRGTLSVLNNSIANLHYTPNSDFNGTDNLEIRLNDMGNVGNVEGEDIKNIDINVAAINDAPIITSAGFYPAFEDSSFNIDNISVDDVDVDEGDGLLQITIDCQDCKVSLPQPIVGISFVSGNGFLNNSMIFTGSLIDINNSIGDLDIISDDDFCGFTNMQITADDMGNYSSSGLVAENHIVDISIDFEERNDPPVNEDELTSQVVPPIVSFSEDALSLNTTDGLWNDALDEQCGPASIITYQYQWQRALDTTDVITDILGANLNAYQITSEDADNYLRSRIIATDDGWGLPASQSDTAYSAFVKMDNLPPFIKPDFYTVQQNAYEDSLFTFNISSYVEDPDNNDMTFSIESDVDASYGSITLNQNTGDVQFQPSSEVNYNSIGGFVDFTYRVSDFQYTSSEFGTISIKIRPRNDAPTFSTVDPGGDVFASENEENIIRQWADPLTIDDGDEEDVQSLSFIIESISNESLFNEDIFGNPIIDIDSFTGQLTFELADNANGSADISVVLQDNGGTNTWVGVSELDTSESFLFTIDVTAINDPPSFDKGSNIVIDEDDGTVNFPGWASNMDDGDPELNQNYQFILDLIGVSDTLFIDLPVIDSNTGQLSFTAAQNVNGEFSIEVILDDDGNNISPSIDVSDPEIFTITINPVNDAPSFSISADNQIVGDVDIIFEDSGQQTINNFAENIYDGDPLANSADIQEVEFELTDLSNPDLFSDQPYIDDNGVLTFTPAENANGQSTVTMVLTDLEGTPNNGVDESVPQIFTISITELNDPPLFNLEHAGLQLAEGEELIRFEDFDDPNTVSISPVRYGTPEDEESQSINFTINPDGDNLFNDNGEEFVNLDINSSTGEITFEMLPDGNGQASFTVTATDNGPGFETGNGDVNLYTRTFNLTINPLADHPQIDLNDPASLIEPAGLQVDSLISVYHGTWIDTIDTDMSGTSNIIGYEYLWQSADNINGDGLQNIGVFHSDSIDYVITKDEAHKYIRAIVKAFDDGWGDVAVPNVDDRFTDTTNWVQVLNTKPVVVDDLEYFTWEDVPLTVNILDGLIGDDVSDTTTDYDKDLDEISIYVANTDVPSVWGQLDINPDGSFYFDPSPPDLTNDLPDNFDALSDTFGIISFTYQLIDEYGATSNNLGQVQIEVGSLNDPPEFTIQNQNDGSGSVIDTIEVLEDFEEIKLGFSIPGHLPLDEAPPNQIVQYDINPSNIDFANLTFNQDEGSIEISAIQDWYGEQHFVVTATDDGPGLETGNGDDNSHQETFYLKIVPVNDVPTFSLAGDTITILEDRGLFDTLAWIVNPDVGAILEEHQQLHYNISYANDDDVNGIQWTFDTDPQILNDIDLNFKVSDDDNGLSEITISIQDDGGTSVDYLNDQDYEIGVDESESQTFFIKVLPVNDPPSFTFDSPKVYDEDSGLITVQNWISNISPGPINESFQHKDLYFEITAYDKFSNKLEGFNTSYPNNILFKVPPQLTIDEIDTTKAHLSFELNQNHNGVGYIRFNLHDQGGLDYEGVDTTLIDNSYIYIRQISDQSEDFTVYSKPHEYAIDSTTFFIDSTAVEYFRLPYQDFAPDIQIPEKMRFSWEKNDSLDIDTYATINLDTLLSTYYRLEMTTGSSDYTYVLFDFYKDSAEYVDNLFSNDTSYFVEIDMNSMFPAYLDTFTFDNAPYDTIMYIDTAGFTEYTWDVISQNYSRDIYNHDIINNTVADRSVIVDLEVPIAKYSFAQSDLYEEYYELYFQTSEETIENVASIWIDFADTSIYRIPHKIDDYYFHLSSTFINTGIINYNFQVRDLVENVGKTEKTIVFQFFEDGLERKINSQDDLFSIHSSAKSVNEQTGMIIFSEDSNFNNSNAIQMTSEYHVYPYSQRFNEPVKLEFENIEILDDSWKYSIRYKEDEDWYSLDTDIKDDVVSAKVLSGGIYSVFYDENAISPIPEKFELVNLYPNPFNPLLTIRYNLDSEQQITIEVYNILGQKVSTLFNQKMQPGYHSIQWNGKNNQGALLGSGVYFIKISNEKDSYIGKVSFIK